MLDFLAEKKILQPTDKLLDIGAGGGQISSLFTNKFKINYSGITVNEGEIKSAEARGINLINADMHDLPFDDHYFDAIYAGHVLEHSIAPLIALYEWKRALKNSGFLILWGPIGRDFNGKDDGTCVYGCKDHLITPTYWQYKWMFEIAELKSVYELDLPYQIETDKQEKAYRNFDKKLQFLSKLGLTILPQYSIGTARLFVLRNSY